MRWRTRPPGVRSSSSSGVNLTLRWLGQPKVAGLGSVGRSAPSMKRSRRSDAGCDLLVVQGVEAGGHVRGTVGLFPLLDEVRQVVELPLVAAGGIGTGRAMAAALTAGADAVRVGTRFVAARESIAHPAYVAALVASQAEDTVITTAFGDGWPDAPHRVLKSCLDAGHTLGSAQSWGPNWPTADDGGPIEAQRALYAGQSVGAVHSRQEASEIVAELVGDAEALLMR